MGRNVLVPLAPGFEEIETITVVDVLRRAGARVTLAGTEAGLIEGSRGVQVNPDADWDGLVERYPGAVVSNFDGQPQLTEMDALVAYLQSLGTLTNAPYETNGGASE